MTSLMRISRGKVKKVKHFSETSIKIQAAPKKLKLIQQTIIKLVRLFRRVKNVASKRAKKRLKVVIFHLLRQRHRILAPPAELQERLPRIRKLRRTIDTYKDEEIPMYFRFRSKEQLHRLMLVYQIPGVIRMPQTGNIFHGEEFLLIGLYRLHRPTILSDGCFKTLFGFGHTAVSMIFNAFLDFMVDRCSYLLLDNIEFWLPYLPSCAQALRDKCLDRQYYERDMPPWWWTSQRWC